MTQKLKPPRHQPTHSEWTLHHSKAWGSGYPLDGDGREAEAPFAGEGWEAIQQFPHQNRECSSIKGSLGSLLESHEEIRNWDQH